MIDDVDDMYIGLNDVDNSGGGTRHTNRGPRPAEAIIMTSRARVILEGGVYERPGRNQYARVEVTGRIPNWFEPSPPRRPEPCFNQAANPSPHFGMKNGQCLKSCGGLGGTVKSPVACRYQNRLAVDSDAYDVAYCCR